MISFQHLLTACLSTESCWLAVPSIVLGVSNPGLPDVAILRKYESTRIPTSPFEFSCGQQTTVLQIQGLIVSFVGQVYAPNRVEESKVGIEADMNSVLYEDA